MGAGFGEGAGVIAPGLECWLHDLNRLVPFLHLRNRKLGFSDCQENLREGQMRINKETEPCREWLEETGMGVRGACQEPAGEVGAGTGGLGAGTTPSHAVHAGNKHAGLTGIWRLTLAVPCPYHAESNTGGVFSQRAHYLVVLNPDCILESAGKLCNLWMPYSRDFDVIVPG